MPSVQLSQVSHRFGSIPVLDRLDLSVQDGEYLVLLGASGSGKTTLLRTIAGFTRPESGRVLFGDQDMTHEPPRSRDLAYVPQAGGLYPHLTIRRSIELGLNGRVPKSELRGRIHRAASAVELEDLLDRRPHQLSGGQLRRAAVAKAIARGASVRLLDEPLSALDAHLRFQIEDDLRNLHRSSPGVTIHVTHDGQEAMRLADRIAIMGEGKILQIDSPSQVYEQPHSPQVAAALGTSPFRTFELERIDTQWVLNGQTTVAGPDAAQHDRCVIGYYEADVCTDAGTSVADRLNLGQGRYLSRNQIRWFLNHPARPQ